MKQNQFLSLLPLRGAMLCMFLALFTISCEKTELSEVERSANQSMRDAQSKTSATVVKLQSGQDLFKQIMFARGEATEIIPELKRVRDLSGVDMLDKDQRELAELIEDAIANVIAKSDPKFFDEFADYIRSGNPVKVQHGLKIAGEHIVKAMSESNPELYLLTQLREEGEFYKNLSDEEKKRLRKIAELDRIDFNELREILKDLDITNRIYKNIALQNAANLQRALQIQLDLNVNVAQVLAKHVQLDKDINLQNHLNLNLQNHLNLQNQLNLNLQNHLDLQLDRNINIAKQINISRAFNADLNYTFDTGVGATVWRETDVFAIAYVAVAVVAVAVVHVIDFTPMPGPEFNDKILFQEQLVANITKNFDAQGQFR